MGIHFKKLIRLTSLKKKKIKAAIKAQLPITVSGFQMINCRGDKWLGAMAS